MTLTSKTIRKLAAIMFSDMVGYTAMMQTDEQRAITSRRRHRKIMREKVSAHNGEILQYYGDGTLTIFDSAIEAVDCAIEIQQLLQQEPKVALRIGLHTGDIVYNDEGIYGNGVNIASRIEALAIEGSVMVSDKVYDEIKNHNEFQTISMGKFELKNVHQPVEVFALSNQGLRVPRPMDLNSKTSASYQSIAVLPFVNMSSDTENEYFSDGITEEIINALTKVEGLQVTSRTSCFSFKGKNEDIRNIGTQLGVNTILEGSVRKAGNKVRITAQLINVNNGYHLWSESYDRQLADILEIQDEISNKIAFNLKEKLSKSAVKESLVNVTTRNIDAYNSYLKGLFHLNKWNPENAKKAIAFFEEAVQKEPSMVEAYVKLAHCYSFMGASGQIKPKGAAFKARDLAKKALSLDPNHYGAYVSIGLVNLLTDYNLTSAKNNFEKAVRLNPGIPYVHESYALYLNCVDNHDKAVEESRIAVKLDPLSINANMGLGRALQLAGKTDEAIEQFNKVLALDSNYRAAIEAIGWVYLSMEEYPRAIEYFLTYQQKVDHPLKGHTGLGFAYGVSGQTKKATECLNKVLKRSNEDKEIDLSVDLAIIYVGLKEFDKAIEQLKKAINEKVGGVIFIKNYPIFKALHDRPEFKELVNSVGLTEN
ncbi:adenylate/guanylate cyclase domain-containing protein [Fulvivirgaceae bacterium BMA12]|uniref:Adenylate/guanylate cyclase domain-containing protein n=1 Tax=Agaribacillus aureus TaxID=3051825 RepID=A0ABT8L4P6_9BACT|nr:adenylate/guanylate cyclase domain-containing protein [Fulvivirgaceae bacterium BMA12]